MKIRHQVLVLADATMFFILLSTGVIFAIHPHGIFAHWELIPYIVYPCLGFVASLATILLYIGVYKLSTAYITAWGFFMLFMWQVVLILIIVTKVFDKIHGTKDKMKEMEKYWGKTLMILELWLCAWIILMFRTYKFYVKILRFKNNPQFIRQSAILIRRLSEANLQRNRRSTPTV